MSLFLPLCSPAVPVLFAPSHVSCSRLLQFVPPRNALFPNLPEPFKNPYLCLPLSSPISAPSLRSRLLPFSRCDSPFLPTLWQATWLCFLPALSSSAPYFFLCQHHDKTGHLTLRLEPMCWDLRPAKILLET